MAIIQISSILNSALASYLEPETEFAADLSNVFEVGKTLADGAFSDTTLNGVIDKTAATLFETPTYYMDKPSIRKSASDYRGAVEVISVEVGNFSDNESWEVIDGINGVQDWSSNSFERMFGAEFPTIKAKYYDTIDTVSFKYTTFEDQFRNAFKSREDMESFFGAMITAINVQLNYGMDMRDKLAFSTAVIAHINEYTAAKVVKQADMTGTTKNEKYASFINQLKAEKRALKRFDKNNKGIRTSTGDNNLKLYINAEAYDDLTSYLYDAHTPELLNIPVERIDTFTDILTTGDKIKLKAANTTGDFDTLENVVAVLYDDRAVFTAYDNTRVKTVPVANCEFTNHFVKYNKSTYINLDYPMIIFTKNGSQDFTQGTATE